MKKFKRIYVETTNVCNLDCSFCPKTTRKNKLMTPDEFEAVIQKIQPHTKFIYLHLMGEPLLNPKLEQFLEIASNYKMTVNITTNATLLKNKQAVLLQSNTIRQINISLHSFESNDLSFTLTEYVQQIGEFIKAARETSQLIISIRLWNMDSETLRGNNKLNEDILDLLQQEIKPLVNIREALLEKSSVKLHPNVYLNMAQKFEWPDATRETLSTQVFCHGLRDHLGILADGTVVPCCLDSEGTIKLGNIFNQSLQEIVESERAVKIYEGFSNRQAVESLCQRCEYATRY